MKTIKLVGGPADGKLFATPLNNHYLIRVPKLSSKPYKGEGNPCEDITFDYVHYVPTGIMINREVEIYACEDEK